MGSERGEKKGEGVRGRAREDKGEGVRERGGGREEGRGPWDWK